MLPFIPIKRLISYLRSMKEALCMGMLSLVVFLPILSAKLVVIKFYTPKKAIKPFLKRLQDLKAVFSGDNLFPKSFI